MGSSAPGHLRQAGAGLDCGLPPAAQELCWVGDQCAADPLPFLGSPQQAQGAGDEQGRGWQQQWRTPVARAERCDDFGKRCQVAHLQDASCDAVGMKALERIWSRPTLDVNGMWSGYTGEGSKTVLPSVAGAKVSMRLVPDQHPDKIADLFEAYVRDAVPKTMTVQLTRMHGGKPWMTSFDNAFVQAAGRAIEKGFGKKPVFTREGGSIPVVSTFQEELGLPSVLFGVGLPDENAHAPNERLDLVNFHNGVIASAYLYDEIGRLGRDTGGQ